MTYKISGILNNCGLHIAVPSVVQYLDTLANSPSPETLPFYDKYLDLKNIFCQYYKLPADTSFKKLSQFISTKSFIAQQLILGPILRLFTDKLYRERLEFGQYSLLADLPRDDDLDDPSVMPGKYREIELRTLVQYLLTPLGIKVDAVYEKQDTRFIKVESFQDQEIGAISQISIYNANQHYELSEFPSDAPSSSNDVYADFEAELSKASSSTNESQLMHLPDHDGAEIEQKKPREINQSVKDVLKKMKTQVRQDFQRPVHFTHYYEAYKTQFFSNRDKIETYASKTEDDYKQKGEMLLDALSGNYGDLNDAINKEPLEYQAIKALLESLTKEPDNKDLKTQLNLVLQEALEENDRQLAEVYQAHEFNLLPKK